MEYFNNRHIYKDFANQKIQCDTRYLTDIRKKKNVELDQLYQEICQFTNTSTQLTALCKLYDLSQHEEWREKIVTYYFTAKITACLHSTDKKLQYMAACVLANITLGSKIIFEKAKKTNGEYYLENSLSSLLFSCDLEDLLQPVLGALTNIAADFELVCAKEILENLNKILSSRMNSITTLKKISQLICNMSSHKKINKENFQQMTSILNYLVKYKDKIIFTRVTTTVLLLSKMGSVHLNLLIDSHVLSWLIEFLNHNCFGEQHIALITIGNFAASTETHTQAVLDGNLLPYLCELLLHENNDICEDATYVVSEIVAKSQTYKQAVIDAGLLSLVVENLNKGKNKLRRISVRVVQNMFENSTQNQKDFIMGCEPILGLCELLKSLYYIFEFSLLDNVLQCLLTILKESDNTRGIALKIEECGGLQFIQELSEKSNFSKNHNMLLLNKILQEYLSDA